MAQKQDNKKPRLKLSEFYIHNTRLVCLDDIYKRFEGEREALAPSSWIHSDNAIEFFSLVKDPAHENIVIHHDVVYASPKVAIFYADSLDKKLAESLIGDIFSINYLLGLDDITPTLEHTQEEDSEGLKRATKILITALSDVLSPDTNQNMYDVVFDMIHKHILGHRQSSIRGLLKKPDETTFSSKSGSIREYFTPEAASIYRKAELSVADYIRRNYIDKRKPINLKSIARYLRHRKFRDALFAKSNSCLVKVLCVRSRDIVSSLYIGADKQFKQILSYK